MSLESMGTRSMLRRAHAGLLLLLSVAGCMTSEREGEPKAEALGDRVAAVKQDLTLGSAGPEVSAVHAYLTKYGYLPNEELARSYPGWTPIVADVPAHDDVYDELSQAAVLAYQRNMGVAQTGIVDAQTREMLNMPRCGHFDGPVPSLVEKYAFSTVNPKLNKVFIRWRLDGNSDHVPRVDGEAAITRALATWSAQVPLTFLKAAPGEVPDIKLVWGEIADPVVYAQTAPDPAAPATRIITLDSAQPWSVAATPAAGAVDFESVVLHELGHAIGIAHSSLSSSVVMWPSIAPGQRRRVLQQEDAIPASVLYDQWTVVTPSNFAKDIAVSNTGAVWVIGTTCTAGNCSIKKWNGTTWDTASGSAHRIALDPSSVPWVIKANGDIFKRSGASATSGSWSQVTGCAKDIAIGNNGAVWILGCESAFGGFSIKKWNATSSTWESADGVAVRIGVNHSGRPLVISPDGKLYVRSGSSATSGTWGEVISLGAAPTANTDLVLDRFGYAYVIAASDHVKVLGQNAAGEATVKVNDLFTLRAAATRAIGVGQLPSGTTGVWAVQTDGTVMRQTK